MSAKLVHKLVHASKKPVFARVSGEGHQPPKQKAPGSSPGGGMAGNPVFAGVSGFCVNGHPRNTWSNIYANTQVSWFQTVTQTVTQIMLTCVSFLSFLSRRGL
jgi:hypothetical protein